tara:strand:+ start:933 stop:1190 length:258 start_codon:yes stop_codon:yes gene_type:complete
MIDYPPGLSFDDQQHLLEHGYEYTPLPVADPIKKDKMNKAKSLFIESVLKPDTSLRACAHNQECYNELMEVRDHVLDYLGYHEKT